MNIDVTIANRGPLGRTHRLGFDRAVQAIAGLIIIWRFTGSGGRLEAA